MTNAQYKKENAELRRWAKIAYRLTLAAMDRDDVPVEVAGVLCQIGRCAGAMLDRNDDAEAQIQALEETP